jgi:hypothetical protein
MGVTVAVAETLKVMILLVKFEVVSSTLASLFFKLRRRKQSKSQNVPHPQPLRL